MGTSVSTRPCKNTPRAELPDRKLVISYLREAIINEGGAELRLRAAELLLSASLE